MAACTACTQPAPDSTICRNCQDRVAADLRKIPWLAEQLTITLTRQARLGDRNHVRSSETPLAYEPRASTDLETFRLDLARWATTVAEHRSITIDEPATPTRLSRWLLRWNGAAAQLPDAADYAAKINAMVKAAQRTIDRAPDLRYVGPCEDCGSDMYVTAGRTVRTVICRTDGCDAEYPMEERRAWLLEQTYGRLLTAHELSRAIAELVPGEPLTPNRISQWASRGRLVKYLPHPRDPHKRVRFLVEEVITRLRESVEADSSQRNTGPPTVGQDRQQVS